MSIKRLAAGLLLFLAMAMAQEYRGTILGGISDPSGAAVAGASIEAQNVATNAVVKTSSNEAGRYQIPFLLPGVYTVRVAVAGFKRVERKAIKVSTNESVALDFTLEIGAANESITVTAAPPMLDTTNADLGQVVERSYVSMVVVDNGRNVMNIRDLTPGVTGGTGSMTAAAQANFSIAGGGGTRGDNEIIVDGAPVNTASGQIGFVPALDTVEEVRVHTTMFDAALGHSNGGAMSIVTRSGENQPHGTAFLFKRWNELNANTWTNNRLGLPKPPVSYQLWGYSLNGPVWIPKVYNGKNRTFFSISLDRDHNPRDLTRQARVPTQAEKGGDFSQTLNLQGGPLAVYDPLTTVVSGNAATRQLFAGARIPTARISPIGAAVLGKYPAPNINGAQQLGAYNWGLSRTTTVDQSGWSARIDHVLTSRQRLFGRVGLLDRHGAPDTLIRGEMSYPVNGTADMGEGFQHRVNVTLDDTIVVSPSLVGSIRVSGLSLSITSRYGAADADPKELQLPDVIVANQAVRGWANFILGDNLPALGARKSFSRETVYSLVSTWTKLSGRRSTKFGVDYRQNRNNSVSPGNNATGSFTVGHAFTQSDPFNRNASNTSGAGMASLLLGLADSGDFGANTATSVRNNFLGLFVQNDWRATSRFTLNLGLRYELESPYLERYNRNSYRFDGDAALPVQVPGMNLRGGLLFAGVNGNPRAASPDKNNFGPRVGFAYSPFSKTVIRGGYGVFYNTVSATLSAFGAVNSFNATTSFVGTTDGGATPAATLANPFPAGLVQPVGSSVGLMAQVGDALTFLTDRRVNPYNQQWQFSVQRELPARVLLEAAYMGMHSLKQVGNFNLNEKPDQYLPLGRAENNAVPNPFRNVFPATSTLGRGATITQNRLWVRYSQFTTLTVQGLPTGNAMYHSLQVKADKRLSHGFNVLLAYTFSRLMVNNTTSVVNERHYRAVSDLDQKHVMRLAFTYELPMRFDGGGLNRVWKHAFGGWAVSGLGMILTGTPLSVSQVNGRPIRLRSPKLSGPVVDRLGDLRDASGRILNPYFDLGAFQALPSQYTITPELPALDDLRGPTQRAVNMGLFKSFPLRERLKLELRIEAEDATNTPFFGPPGTNMSSAATFGVITSASGNRQAQAAMRLVF